MDRSAGPVDVVASVKTPALVTSPKLGEEIVRVEDLHVSFGEKKVLKGLNLSIRQGDNYVVLGPSGCGKSVLLKHIMGLFAPESGHIYLWGQDIVGMSEMEMFPLRKRMAIVFQEGALLNSLTVEQNLALALTSANKLPDDRIFEIVKERLEWVNMAGAENLKIAELSGGMKKRVSIARGLATDPELIIYDEPTTGLDPPLADTIDELIYSLSQRLKNTSLTVTHDLVAARYFGTRLGFFHHGRIVLETTPDQLDDITDEDFRHFIKRQEHHVG